MQVGSSSMIGCDNEDCEFEWFHWECVGIVTPVRRATSPVCPHTCIHCVNAYIFV